MSGGGGAATAKDTPLEGLLRGYVPLRRIWLDGRADTEVAGCSFIDLRDAVLALSRAHPALGRLVVELYLKDVGLPAAAKALGLTSAQARRRKTEALAFLADRLQVERNQA